MGPVADDPQAAEALPLPVDVILGKLFTGRAELRDRHGLVIQLVFLMMADSMGMPWLSQPGTWGGNIPCMALAWTMKSFSVLLRAWPMWMPPLEKGGPSWRMNRGAVLIFLQELAIQVLISFHFSSIPGSRLGRPAFMGEGRFWG